MANLRVGIIGLGRLGSRHARHLLPVAAIIPTTFIKLVTALLELINKNKLSFSKGEKYHV